MTGSSTSVWYQHFLTPVLKGELSSEIDGVRSGKQPQNDRNSPSFKGKASKFLWPCGHGNQVTLRRTSPHIQHATPQSPSWGCPRWILSASWPLVPVATWVGLGPWDPGNLGAWDWAPQRDHPFQRLWTCMNVRCPQDTLNSGALTLNTISYL